MLEQVQQVPRLLRGAHIHVSHRAGKQLGQGRCLRRAPLAAILAAGRGGRLFRRRRTRPRLLPGVVVPDSTQDSAITPLSQLYAALCSGLTG